jgi:Rap1a immunity proteins
MRTFIAGVLALWAGVAQAETTGYDLYQDCSGSSGIYGEAFCLGYISGIWAMDERTCAPAGGVQRGVLEKVYMTWANRHPQMLSLSANTAVQAAIIEAYPCSTAPNPQPRVSKIPSYRGSDQLMPPSR